MAGLIGSVLILISLVLAVGGLDIAALRWGVDSRDQIPDDHLR